MLVFFYKNTILLFTSLNEIYRANIFHVKKRSSSPSTPYLEREIAERVLHRKGWCTEVSQTTTLVSLYHNDIPINQNDGYNNLRVLRALHRFKREEKKECASTFNLNIAMRRRFKAICQYFEHAIATLDQTKSYSHVIQQTVYLPPWTSAFVSVPIG